LFQLVTHVLAVVIVSFTIFPFGNVVPEALSWLAESKVHAVVSLFMRIMVSASLKLVLNRHLGTIDCTLISPIELGCAMHYRVHVLLVFV